MSTAYLYTSPGCPRCSQAKLSLELAGYTVEERDAEGLTNGKYRDVEALTELTMRDYELPVVVIDGEAVDVGTLMFKEGVI